MALIPPSNTFFPLSLSLSLLTAILVTTSSLTDGADSDWQENGAGYYVNHKYGFGLLNISAAVERARDWELMGEYSYYDSKKIVFNEGKGGTFGEWRGGRKRGMEKKW